jgi:hypothetical protein
MSIKKDKKLAMASKEQEIDHEKIQQAVKKRIEGMNAFGKLWLEEVMKHNEESRELLNRINGTQAKNE